MTTGNLSSVTVVAREHIDAGPDASMRAEVTVPTSAINKFFIEESVAIVIATPSEEAPIPEKAVVEAQSVVRVTVAWLNGTEIAIEQLAEPIIIKLPMSFSVGLVCSFWNETSEAWDDSGLTTLTETPGDQMVCATNHLTIFAAIFRGFRDTYTCTQFSLFNKEAFLAIADPVWPQTMAGIMFFMLVGFLLLMFGAAAVADTCRRRRGDWREELFLLPDGVLRAQDADLNVDNAGELEAEDPEVENDETKGSRWKRACGPVAACGLACVTWLRFSGALRDAFDDVLGNYFQYFSEVRDLIEQLWEGFGCCGGGVHEGYLIVRFSWQVMSSSLFVVARRHISGCLVVSQDTVDLVMEDEDVQLLLKDRLVETFDRELQANSAHLEEPAGNDSQELDAGGDHIVDLEVLVETPIESWRRLARSNARFFTEDFLGIWDSFVATTNGSALRSIAARSPHDGQDTAVDVPVEGLPDHEFIMLRRPSLTSVLSEGSRPEAPQNCEVQAMYDEAQCSEPVETPVVEEPAGSDSQELDAGGGRIVDLDVLVETPTESLRPLARPGTRFFTEDFLGIWDSFIATTNGTALRGVPPPSHSHGTQARSASQRLQLREDMSVLRPSPSARVRLREEAQVVPASEDDRVREELLAQLYQEVNQELNDAFDQVAKVRTLPMLVARGFLAQTPLVSTFARDFQICCKLRAFLFALEMLGTVALSALFFSATTGTVGRRARSDCAKTGDARELIGRLLGIGIGSIFIAGIPVSILTSMHTRGFKRVPLKEGPAWRRQLRAWRAQDRMIYSAGSVYGILLLTFVVLFLANISEKDGENILLSAGISLGQDLIGIPLAIAIFSPVMAVLSTALLSLIQGVRRREIIRKRYFDLFLKEKKLQHGELAV